MQWAFDKRNFLLIIIFTIYFSYFSVIFYPVKQCYAIAPILAPIGSQVVRYASSKILPAAGVYVLRKSGSSFVTKTAAREASKRWGVTQTAANISKVKRIGNVGNKHGWGWYVLFGLTGLDLIDQTIQIGGALLGLKDGSFGDEQYYGDGEIINGKDIIITYSDGLQYRIYIDDSVNGYGFNQFIVRIYYANGPNAGQPVDGIPTFLTSDSQDYVFNHFYIRSTLNKKLWYSYNSGSGDGSQVVQQILNDEIPIKIGINEPSVSELEGYDFSSISGGSSQNPMVVAMPDYSYVSDAFGLTSHDEIIDKQIDIMYGEELPDTALNIDGLAPDIRLETAIPVSPEIPFSDPDLDTEIVSPGQGVVINPDLYPDNPILPEPGTQYDYRGFLSTIVDYLRKIWNVLNPENLINSIQDPLEQAKVNLMNKFEWYFQVKSKVIEITEASFPNDEWEGIWIDHPWVGHVCVVSPIPTNTYKTDIHRFISASVIFLTFLVTVKKVSTILSGGDE